jgi:hypothetical protein
MMLARTTVPTAATAPASAMPIYPSRPAMSLNMMDQKNNERTFRDSSIDQHGKRLCL